MILQEKIPVPPSSAIASYNYTDIAEATGVSKFWLAVQAISGNTSYLLTQNQVYSQGALSPSNEINISDTSVTFALTAFNLPKTIKGTGYLNIGVKTSAGTGSFKATLKNSVTGNIVAVSSPDTIGTAGATFLLPMTILNTRFKAGEALQLTIEDQNAGTLFIGADPQNRDGTNITPSITPSAHLTASALYIPFKLDV